MIQAFGRQSSAISFQSVLGAGLLFFLFSSLSYAENAKPEEPVYAVVSQDIVMVKGDPTMWAGFSDGTDMWNGLKGKVIALPPEAFSQLARSLSLVEKAAKDFDAQSQTHEVDEIEVSYQITGEGNIGIAKGSAEGAIKFVLKKRGLK